MTPSKTLFGTWEIRGADLHADVEVGISLMGRAGFGETPLLKLIGELRWRQLAGLCGVDSAALVDEEGRRLYATFFYVELRFPPGMSMADISENDRLTLVNTLTFDGDSILDGMHFFFPADWPEEDKKPFADGAAALAAGVPCMVTSNAFVRMVQGASWLKKGVPAVEGMKHLPIGEGGTENYRKMVSVSGGKRTFRRPPDTYEMLTDGPVAVEYTPDPDRDLNGLGLLYYANYPAVLDYAERRVLTTTTRAPIDGGLLDFRAVATRDSAYVSNIVPPDVIEVQLEAWVENPYRAGLDNPEQQPVRLFLNYEMYRRSDGRKMMVSSADKVLQGISVAEAGLVPFLKAGAEQSASAPGDLVEPEPVP